MVKVGHNAASPEKNVSGGIRSNAGRTLIKIPSHLLKTHHNVPNVLKHGAIIVDAIPDHGKTAVCKNKATCKSNVGTCVKTKDNNAEAAIGEVLAAINTDGAAITVRGGE